MSLKIQNFCKLFVVLSHIHKLFTVYKSAIVCCQHLSNRRHLCNIKPFRLILKCRNQFICKAAIYCFLCCKRSVKKQNFSSKSFSHNLGEVVSRWALWRLECLHEGSIKVGIWWNIHKVHKWQLCETNSNSSPSHYSNNWLNTLIYCIQVGVHLFKDTLRAKGSCLFFWLTLPWCEYR